MTPRRLILTLLCITGLMTGCSLAELAYSFADRLILEKLDERLGLNNAQEARALELVRARLERHRAEELPLYIDWLGRVRTEVAAGLDSGSLESLYSRFGELVQMAVARSLPDFAVMLGWLSDAQIAYFGEQVGGQFAESAERIREHAAEEGGEGSHETEQMVKAIERWTGPLRTEQKNLIEKHVRSWPVNDKAWLAWRRERFAGLLELLRGNAPDSSIAAYLENQWLDNRGMPADLRTQWDSIQHDYRRMLLELDRSLSEEQRDHLLRRIDELLATLRSLRGGESG